MLVLLDCKSIHHTHTTRRQQLSSTVLNGEHLLTVVLYTDAKSHPVHKGKGCKLKANSWHYSTHRNTRTVLHDIPKPLSYTTKGVLCTTAHTQVRAQQYYAQLSTTYNSRLNFEAIFLSLLLSRSRSTKLAHTRASSGNISTHNSGKVNLWTKYVLCGEYFL